MSNKEIGQFFSGPRVSNLLVLAAEIADIESTYAIDPMVGQADMLVALQQHGAHAERLYGIDIDGDAVNAAKARLGNSYFLKCDALSPSATDLYNSHEWDLVITNPPYVRYQALDTFYGENSVETIRKRLIETLEALDAARSKRPYLEAARSYSGLSDLAVPCWILCACLVKPGGKLAMVLPDAWLKREYASVIYDVLNTDFTIDRIIIDESRTWFPDAQVKTNLLIATKRNDSRTTPDNTHVHHIGLSKRAASEHSLSGALAYKGHAGDEVFVDLCRNGVNLSNSFVWARREDLSRVSYASCPEAKTRTVSLRDWRLNVGQGLRTGANGFFYLMENEDGRVSNSIWENCAGLEPANACRLPLMPALRYQDEIGDAYTVAARKTGYRLLLISKPIENSPDIAERELTSLRKYIDYCEEHDVVQGGRRQHIPSLSAVRTNGPLSSTPDVDRYWYMLPALKDRHLPDLVIPRINGGVVRAYLLAGGRQVVADANFSTIWVSGKDRKMAHAALALLNSTYVRLELERHCSVLGGGALKCEAVSLRKLELPKPKSELIEALSRRGAELAIARTIDEATAIQTSIDSDIAHVMAVNEQASVLLARWREELDIRLKLRNE
ncbi:N-6 DNA methylase [Adlercreutzia sp. ZJ304]|uniref:Eco57I restriction-modification methylase domain-containing protein n=1 Tax=Adlercreutzia sp. ZJ304 TaxID=2709791 RepID=UPI0013E9D208|nr:N-6 DNA methylase [Adlercreutzia sp. ZJ304]